jgi:hypothetical protein
MFFLERFMKTLKDFVRQTARPEGSMSEGWLIQEGIVFISQYLHQADSLLPHPFSIQPSLSAMDVREEDGPTIIPQGKGRSVKFGRELCAKLSSFCILNTEVMRPWVDRYNAARVSIETERAQIRREVGQRAPLPSHIIGFRSSITAEWVHAEIDTLDQSEHRVVITQDEWEYARGCSPTVP